MTKGKIALLLRRVESRLEKECSHKFGQRPVRWPGRQAFISFTFDDFPRSAYATGGMILKDHSLRGTFFASFGLMGRASPSGEIFTREDLDGLLADGHELGSHTYDHLDPWATGPALFEQSLVKNRDVLGALLPGRVFRTLAYPLKEPRPRVKRVAQRHFDCCRGGGRMINSGRIDLNLLKSFFIDKKNRDTLGYFEDAISDNRRARGWLIFSTHDVSGTPSDYGCRPDVFERIVRLAVGSGAVILPVSEVYDRISEAEGGPDPGSRHGRPTNNGGVPADKASP